MSKYLIEGSSLTAIGSAIRTKTGDSSLLSVPTGMVNAITNIPTGGGSRTVAKEYKDVNFFDWDGTLLFSYTTAEFLALSAFPTYPERDDTVFYQWNWTLAGAKKEVEGTKYLNIGAECYANDTDGAGWIYLYATAGIMSVDLTGYTGVNAYMAFNVDWGDGSTSETGLTSYSHIYSTSGFYRVRVWNPTNEGEPVRVEVHFTVNDSDPYGGYISQIYFGRNVYITYYHNYSDSKNRCFTALRKICVRGWLVDNDWYQLRFRGPFNTSLRYITIPMGGIRVWTTNQQPFMYSETDGTTANALKNISLPESNNGMFQGLAQGFGAFSDWCAETPIVLSYNQDGSTGTTIFGLGSKMYNNFPDLYPRNKVIIPVYKENGVWVSPPILKNGVFSRANTNACDFDYYIFHKPTDLQDIKEKAFGIIATTTYGKPRIFVPADTKADFVAFTNWSYYADQIFELPQEA